MKYANLRSIIVGLVFGLTAPYFAMQVASNASIINFLGESIMTWRLFLPSDSQEWTNESILGVLTPRMDDSGFYSCIHVIPISPKYQVTSVSSKGIKTCCDTNNSLYVPVIDMGDYSDYYCGKYPNQQTVRVLHNKQVVASN